MTEFRDINAIIALMIINHMLLIQLILCLREITQKIHFEQEDYKKVSEIICVHIRKTDNRCGLRGKVPSMTREFPS